MGQRAARLVRSIAALATLVAAAGCASGAGAGAARPAPPPQIAHTGSSHIPSTAPPPAPLRAGERFTTLAVDRPYA